MYHGGLGVSKHGKIQALNISLSWLTKQSTTTSLLVLNPNSRKMFEDQVYFSSITSHADIDSFFYESVTLLPDDYFTSHDSHCGICHEADPAAELPDPRVISPAENSTHVIYPAPIVQIHGCTHVFHKLCLHTWITYT